MRLQSCLLAASFLVASCSQPSVEGNRKSNDVENTSTDVESAQAIQTHEGRELIEATYSEAIECAALFVATKKYVIEDVGPEHKLVLPLDQMFKKASEDAWEKGRAQGFDKSQTTAAIIDRIDSSLGFVSETVVRRETSEICIPRYADDEIANRFIATP